MAISLSTNFYVAAVLVAAALMQSSSAQTTHAVGDAQGWRIPIANPAAYSTWAANKTFTVGDILVFNFMSSAHDVSRVRKADYDSCSTSNPIWVATTSPANIILNATGEHYFLCGFTGHCASGQKLAINVSAATASPAPQPSSSSPSPAPQASIPAPVSVPPRAPVSSPSPSPVSTPSRSPVTYTVGDTAGWNVLGASAFRSWASTKDFVVGDILVFNYANGAHDVAEVTKGAFGSCNGKSPLSRNSRPPTRITLTTPGEHFYICTVPTHCSGGQQLAINVTGNAIATPSPSPAASETRSTSTTSSPSPSPAGVNPPPSPASATTSLGVTTLSAATFLSLMFVAFLH